MLTIYENEMEKRNIFQYIASLTCLHSNKLQIERVSRYLCEAPARKFNLLKQVTFEKYVILESLYISMYFHLWSVIRIAFYQHKTWQQHGNFDFAL